MSKPYFFSEKGGDWFKEYNMEIHKLVKVKILNGDTQLGVILQGSKFVSTFNFDEIVGALTQEKVVPMRQFYVNDTFDGTTTDFTIVNGLLYEKNTA